MMRWVLLFLCLISPAHAQWQYQFSFNTNPIGGVSGFWFQWPLGQNGLHYVVQPTGPLTGKSTITFVGSVSGAPFQAYNNGLPDPTPAACHLYFQEAGDNLSGQGPYVYFRWWNEAHNLTLQNGDFWLQGTFNPAEWVSVFGERGDASAAATAGFQQAMANAAFIGFTCGGAGDGHGVSALNPGSMTVMGYGIQ